MVDDYHAMLEAGILSEDDRVELIDGQIIEKMTIGPKHIRVVNVLTEVAVKRASDVVEVSIQNPVRLGRYTEPEPDVVLLRRDRDVTRVPHAEDVLLLVEVADATLGLDKQVKPPIMQRPRSRRSGS
jgi:Uma2 family endonuclease